MVGRSRVPGRTRRPGRTWRSWGSWSSRLSRRPWRSGLSWRPRSTRRLRKRDEFLSSPTQIVGHCASSGLPLPTRPLGTPMPCLHRHSRRHGTPHPVLHIGPVDHIPPRADVVGAPVLIVNVVGMFPHVQHVWDRTHCVRFSCLPAVRISSLPH